MNAPERFEARPKRDGLKVGVWDHRFGQWADKWFTLIPSRAHSRADYLNRATERRADEMATSDGLGV